MRYPQWLNFAPYFRATNTREPSGRSENDYRKLAQFFPLALAHLSWHIVSQLWSEITGGNYYLKNIKKIPWESAWKTDSNDICFQTNPLFMHQPYFTLVTYTQVSLNKGVDASRLLPNSVTTWSMKRKRTGGAQNLFLLFQFLSTYPSIFNWAIWLITLVKYHLINKKCSLIIQIMNRNWRWMKCKKKTIWPNKTGQIYIDSMQDKLPDYWFVFKIWYSL
jgi:hypothetical protein